MTASFWINEPSVLLKNEYIGQLWPSQDLSRAEKYNAITRMILILTFLGYILKKNKQIIYVGVIIILSMVLLYKAQNKENFKGFFSDNSVYDFIKDEYQQPSIQNPMSNVLPGENSLRKPAPPSYLPEVEENINEKTKEIISNNLDEPKDKLFKDLGENLNFEHSMRSWYSTANTQIPNNQDEFAKFCYNDLATHKQSIKELEEQCH
jgi:hypothetical protein